jgi:hypothetical protein
MITTTLQYYDINGTPSHRVCIQSGFKGGAHVASKEVSASLRADLLKCMALSRIDPALWAQRISGDSATWTATGIHACNIIRRWHPELSISDTDEA